MSRFRTKLPFGGLWNRLLAYRDQWQSVLLVAILIRLFLNIPALIGANWFPIQDSGIGLTSFGADPRSLPGIWLRWDSFYYVHIASDGYSYHGDDIGFFPLYPLLIRISSLGNPNLMPWAGWLLSNVAFVVALTLLWTLVSSDHSSGIAWATVITLSLFPTSFFLSALYTESLFLFLSLFVFWFSTKKRFLLAGVFVSLASLTRINGILLAVIPLVEILQDRRSRNWLEIVKTSIASAFGAVLYIGFIWVTQGAPHEYILAQQVVWKRSITFPWQTLFDSLGVALFGLGGNENSWYMRVLSAQDLAATLLFVMCTIVAFFYLRRSLFVYLAAAVLFLLVSHGPYSFGLMAAPRYVLGFFPGFIALGILLDRIGNLKWLVWFVSGCLLIFETAWFANGRYLV